MKRKNIKVGGYVFCKSDGLRKVISAKSGSCDEVGVKFARSSAKMFRRPQVRDLKEGDVFKARQKIWTMGDPYMITEDGSGDLVAYAENKNQSAKYFKLSEKIRIISLASEKVEPKYQDSHSRKTELVRESTKIYTEMIKNVAELERKTAKRWCLVYGDGAVIHFFPKKPTLDNAKNNGVKACVEAEISWFEGEGLDK